MMLTSIILAVALGSTSAQAVVSIESDLAESSQTGDGRTKPVSAPLAKEC